MENQVKNIEEEKNKATPLDDELSELTTPMKRSRLQETKVNRTKRNIVLILLGIVAIVLFMFFFGLQLLINFSLFVGNLRGDSKEVSATNQENKESFVPRPIIDQIPKATKESDTEIKGSAQNAKEVELFINDSLFEKKSVNNDEFTFTKVPLKEGENHIKVRAISGKSKSEFSESVRIAYRQKAPDLDVETPRDGDAFSGGVSILKVKGKTVPYAKVTINGAQAIIDDTGTFRYDYRMQSGENKLMVTVTDEAENKTEKEVKFTYSP